MSGKSRLVSKSGEPHDDHKTDDYGQGPIVYTRERATGEYTLVPLVNPSSGLGMNINGAFGGTPDLIHNGTDSAEWTGSNEIGVKVTFNSAAYVIAGAASVEVNSPNLNDTWQFDKGSNLTVSSYVGLSGIIKVDSSWDAGDSVSVYGWDTGTALMVGNTVLLEDYINSADFVTEQGFAIPFADMGLTSGTIDAIRMQQVARSGLTGKWYLDTFQVEETSGSADFSYAPPVDQVFHIERLATTAVSNVTEAVMQSYDKFYGITALTNGLLSIVTLDGVNQASVPSRQLSDFVVFPNGTFTVHSDGTNTIGKTSLDFKIDVDGRTQDVFTFRVQDNLSSILKMEGWLYGWLEDV